MTSGHPLEMPVEKTRDRAFRRQTSGHARSTRLPPRPPQEAEGEAEALCGAGSRAGSRVPW